MNLKNLSKSSSCLIILAMYLFAIALGVLFYWATTFFMTENILLQLLLADIVVTVIIWAFSLLTKNSSVYDPYWSVIPVVILAAFIYLRGTVLNIVDYIVIFTVLIWSVRLTYNWTRGWKGFKNEDWRYRKYKKQYPEYWHLINFFGIQLFPTLAVFTGMLPLYFVLSQPTSYPATIFALIGAAVCLVAVALELIADEQMRKFRRNPENKNKNIDSGVWKYSRHPNYLGEILFWVGIFVMSIPCFSAYRMFSPDNFIYSCLGPVVMILMFIFISIPLMEKHVARKRPEYQEYKQQVSMLIPWFRKKTISAPVAAFETDESGRTGTEDKRNSEDDED